MSRTVIHPNEVNEVMNAKMSFTNPVVGLLGTMFVGTDRYAVMISEVINKKTVKVVKIFDEEWLKENTNTIAEDMPDFITPYRAARYLAENGDFDVVDGKWEVKGTTYTLRKNGRWMPAGDSMWGTCSIHFGKADPYMDPNF